MPVSTDHLADDIKELRESHQHIAEAIQSLVREFGSFRVEVVDRLGALNTGIRTEVAEKFGAMNANLDASRERTDTALAGIRTEVAGIRVEVGEKLGAMRTDLDASRERTDTALTAIRAEVTGIRAEFAEKLGAMRTDLDASRERTDTALTGVRVEVAEKFGLINAHLEGFRGRTEKALQVATWSISILVPLFLSAVGCGFWISWYAGRLDSRVERVESRLDKEQAPVPVPKPR